MANQYDRKLFHSFFYSGFNQHGNYAASNTWYRDNRFHSYGTCIAFVEESQRVKVVDYSHPRNKKVPQKVLFLSDYDYSVTTLSHIRGLRYACPNDYAIMYVPIHGENYTLESLAEAIYAKAMACAKGRLTRKDEVREFKNAVYSVEEFRKHFGFIGTPKNYARLIKRTLALLDDPERYKAWRNAEIQKQIKKSTIANAEERAIRKQYEAEEAERRKQEAEARRVERERILSEISPYAEFCRECLASVPEHMQKAYANMANEIMFRAAMTTPLLSQLSYHYREVLREQLYGECRCGREWNAPTYVMPIARIFIENDAFAAAVDMATMLTGHGVRVATTEVRKFLRMRRLGEGLLGQRFSQGYTFLGNNDIVTVGCHKFAKETVDALDKFMHRSDEEIIADYNAVAQAMTAAYTKLHDSLTPKQNDAAEAGEEALDEVETETVETETPDFCGTEEHASLIARTSVQAEPESFTVSAAIPTTDMLHEETDHIRGELVAATESVTNYVDDCVEEVTRDVGTVNNHVTEVAREVAAVNAKLADTKDQVDNNSARITEIQAQQGAVIRITVEVLPANYKNNG